ncbi:MAG: hypothetical protein OEX12_15055, partial [Gammaproteobacteria bacterium]|nr:hypothetical protein [Gammaproteobacteria bacterium]
FRSPSRDLANDRALRLVREVLALYPEQQGLTTGLAETIQAMRVKQDAGGFKPLSNHNYLKRVLESVTSGESTALAVVSSSQGLQVPAKALSKTAQTIEMLNTFPSPEGIPEWFTRTVCGSMAELHLLGLEGVPAADTMKLVAERWILEMWPKRTWRLKSPQHGAARIRSTFVQVAESTKRWPTVKDIVGQIPTV